jgi:myo-inositol-1(or 4)-monophosphatase
VRLIAPGRPSRADERRNLEEGDMASQLSQPLPDLEATMIGWAEEAAEIARSQFLKTGRLEFKYAREAVTAADHEIERLLTARIAGRFPDDGIFGEEFGRGGPGSSGDQDGAAVPETAGRVWHIDPIDGTLNFALGLPNFCTSLALMDGEKILAACVYAPLHREAFTASRGLGARRNGAPIRVSERSEFAEAIVSAQLQKGGRYVLEPALLQAILLRSLKMRRLGTIALEMAYLAAGRYDALVAGRGRPVQLYDVAAGILLVQEAEGRVSDHTGAPYRPYVTDLVASNGRVHDELIGIISEFTEESSTS